MDKKVSEVCRVGDRVWFDPGLHWVVIKEFSCISTTVFFEKREHVMIALCDEGKMFEGSRRVIHLKEWHPERGEPMPEWPQVKREKPPAGTAVWVWGGGEENQKLHVGIVYKDQDDEDLRLTSGVYWPNWEVVRQP